jgi:hypothetical protein
MEAQELKLANPICSWWKASWLQKGEDKGVSLDRTIDFEIERTIENYVVSQFREAFIQSFQIWST